MAETGRAGALDALYLSPHPDDAVFSCGGQIHRRCRLGQRVLIVTVFDGDRTPAVPSELSLSLYREMGLAPEGVAAARRREDREAAAVLGADLRFLGLPEALERRRSDGEAVYRRFGDLFGRPDPEDGRVIERLARRFEGLDAAEVLAPLAVGDHVDHHLVRRAAAARWGDRLGCFEDLPYALRRRALARAVRARSGARRRWVDEVSPLAATDVDAKVQAAAAYRSQIPPIFGSVERMERRLRRYARRVGGERIWRARGIAG